MDRAKYLPQTSERKRSEKQQVISDLKVNGYAQSFTDSRLDSAHISKQQGHKENPRAYASIPHVKGVFWKSSTCTQQRKHQDYVQTR